MIKHNRKGLSRNHCCRWKAKLVHILCVCLAVFIEHAKRMLHMILSSVASLSFCLYQILPHYVINGTNIGERVVKHKMF